MSEGEMTDAVSTDGMTTADEVQPRPRVAGSRRHPAPVWVDAAPFRAHLRHLMSVGRLDSAEIAVVVGLPTRQVAVLLEGRRGRVVRRVSPEVARRLLRVSALEVRGLRWCVSPANAARVALARLRGDGWSDEEVALAVGFDVDDLRRLTGLRHCNRLLGVRLVGLARNLPSTVDDQDLRPPAAA